VIDPDDPPRWWTVEEADEALPLVRQALDTFRDAAANYQARAEHARDVAGGGGNGHAPGGGEADLARAVVAELEAEGIVLRDPARGLVDFPARAPAGRGYWLCWLEGEDSVTWWHWPETGFAGRTPLSQPPG
jgi:hypothetical protein